MANSVSAARSEAPWHRFGMGLSLLCLVHCLALPWLLASLPAVALAAFPETVRDNEWLHAVLIAPVLLVSGPVLLRGKPGAGRIVVVFVAFALLIGALFADSEVSEQMMTVLGAATLLGAHWMRLRRNHLHG